MVCDIWETEQWAVFGGWHPARPHFSDAAVRTARVLPNVAPVESPAGGCGCPFGWQLDSSEPAESDGWQYRPAVTLPGFQSLPLFGAPTRRRKWRWTGQCQPVAGAFPTDSQPEQPTFVSVVEVFGELVFADHDHPGHTD
eukprot:EG_transcript_14508